MTEPLLEFRGVRAAYEEVEVIHGVDATFEEGVVTAVLGANGAGKSTLLALAAGIMGPSEGEVRFAGEKVRVGSTSSLARRGLCLIPEGRGVFPNLTVRENLWVMTHSGSGRRHVERCAFERFPRLADRGDQPAGTLSGGEQQMLALARAVATSPRLLMLDELSMGLAPIDRRRALQPCRAPGGGGHHGRGGGAIRTHRPVGCHLGHRDGERADRPDRGGERRRVGTPVGVSGTRSTRRPGFAREQRDVRSHRHRHGHGHGCPLGNPGLEGGHALKEAPPDRPVHSDERRPCRSSVSGSGF